MGIASGFPSIASPFIGRINGPTCPKLVNLQYGFGFLSLFFEVRHSSSLPLPVLSNKSLLLTICSRNLLVYI